MIRTHDWDKITDQITKCLSDVLMSYQWETEFCYRGSKMRVPYGIYNKVTRHSAIPSICVGSICLDLATSFPASLGFLIGRNASSYQKVNMHWEQGCVFSYHEKIELKSLTQVSHVTKKIKNRWVKKAKKRKKEKVKLPSIYRSSE